MLGLQMQAYTIVSHAMNFKHDYQINTNNLVDSSERFALQWVQKYIAKFGGDPKKVTM